MTMDARYKELPWDSEHFHCRVAAITDPGLDDDALRAVLSDLRQKGFRLVYHTPAQPLANDALIRAFDGIMADEKVTFAKDLEDESSITVDPHIHSYTAQTVSAELLQLALDAGLYSRFRVDSHFRNNEYALLYRIWIERSVRREIAHEVIVYEEDGHLLGMVTMGEKNNRGDIGLVAVSERARGRGIGKKMMQAAEADFHSRGYRHIQVVTQGINEAACKLYSGAGFYLDEKIYYYHFWL